MQHNANESSSSASDPSSIESGTIEEIFRHPLLYIDLACDLDSIENAKNISRAVKILCPNISGMVFAHACMHSYIYH
jgi:hypothetical protein